jgi:hypothetical protein
MGLVTGAAFAQPATDLGGGVFIAHHPPGLIYSSDAPEGGWCAAGAITGCDVQNNDYLPLTIGTPETSPVWYVVAAFLQESQWCGVEFGITYDGVSILGGGLCVPANGLEIQGPGWPASGTGTSVVTTDVPWVGNFMPVYHFWGYSYYAPGGTFVLGDNMGTPGPVAFANCAQVEFPAVCYGAFGFGDFAGVDCCPELPPPPSWACCLYDGSCIFVTEADCLVENGVWYEGQLCEQIVCPAPVPCCFYHDCVMLHADECVAQGGEVFPGAPDCTDNPCDDLTPTEPSSWGTIKAIYR